jgi:hypothetical protein
MRPSQKMTVIDSVANELERRYSFAEIDTYLAMFDIATRLEYERFGSRADYVKGTISGIDTATLAKMAEDLEINVPGVRTTILQPPHSWPNDNKFRLFISHVSEAKDKATRLRDCLNPY